MKGISVSIGILALAWMLAGEIQAETTPQAVTFASITDKVYGNPPFDLTASADSGLPVTFSVASGPVTISGNTVTILSAGDVTIRASQAGNAEFAPATDVDRSFTIKKAAQTVSFSLPGSIEFSASPTLLEASATSGLAVEYSVISGPATISNNTLIPTGTGPVRIRALQPGHSNYHPAAADRISTIVKGYQDISVLPIGSRIFPSSPFSVDAFSSAELPVHVAVLSGPATVDGNMITLTGEGLIVLQFSQAGNDQFDAAADVTVSFYAARLIASPKISASIKFKYAGEDFVSVSGVLPALPQGYRFEGKALSLNASGIHTVFSRLDEKGRAQAIADAKKPSTIALKMKFKKSAGGSEFAGGNVPFTAKLYGTFAYDLQLNEDATIIKQPKRFYIEMTLDNSRFFTFSGSVIQSFKAGIGGAFKSK